MIFVSCASKQDYERVVATGVFCEAHEVERYLAHRHRGEEQFALFGYCKVCDQATEFLVDRQGGWVEEGEWRPNWRERQVCLRCRLNSRQRFAVAFLKDFVRKRPDSPSIYLTEQVTEVFHHSATSLAGRAEIVGSEYLGPSRARGELVGDLRHEDLESLSFASERFDLVISNDVLEHVPDPARALCEIRRVLKPGGQLFLTTPFSPHHDRNTVRASLVDGNVVHHASPEYHGNPLSAEGSLVYTDFGWELLDVIRGAGLSDARLNLIWSFEYGHLGVPEMFFVCVR
jgi:hypothetical protein